LKKGYENARSFWTIQNTVGSNQGDFKHQRKDALLRFLLGEKYSISYLAILLSDSASKHGGISHLQARGT